MRDDSSPPLRDADSRARGSGSVGLMLGFVGAATAVFFLLLALVCVAFALVYYCLFYYYYY